MRSARSVRGNGLATIAVILAVSIFAAAGLWQLQRAHYKEGLRSRIAATMHDEPITLGSSPASASLLDFRPVQVKGRWLPEKTIFIDNRIRDHIVGYHVITPLQIDGGKICVLVNRGWIAAPPLRTELPQFLTPSGNIEVSGIARVPGARFLELSRETIEGRVWQNLTLERFASWSGLHLQPVVIFQQNPSTDKLAREPVAPEATGLNADRHRGYALTWFGLAAVTLLLALAAKFKSTKHDPKT